MNFGLEKDSLDTIIASIRKIPEVDEALIFGSRALGTQKNASDIDIALKGTITLGIILQLTALLTEAPRFPYKVDIVGYNLIEHGELKKHIDTYGKTIFKK